jgi:FdhD protein
MKELQLGFIETGGMHAAALWNHQHGLRHLSEDIGRHNAVDKTIGMGLMAGVSFGEELLLLSGRCGWDLVAKAARSGIGTIVCIGACSTLAADTARSLGMRIYSFMKRESSVAIGPLS